MPILTKRSAAISADAERTLEYAKPSTMRQKLPARYKHQRPLQEPRDERFAESESGSNERGEEHHQQNMQGCCIHLSFFTVQEREGRSTSYDRCFASYTEEE